MAFNINGVYTPEHKSWDHVGNLVPDVEHSEGERPHGEFKPAAWLPTQFFDKYFEDYYVVMPGKPVAFDNQGRVVPAQYGLAEPNSDITYTATDVTAGVIDVHTGSALLTANIGTFPVSGVIDMMGTGVTLSVSHAAGVAPLAYWQWGGDGAAADDGSNPAHFRKHNYQLQARVPILCDYVLELPLVPAQTAAEAISEATNASNLSTFTAVSNLPVAKNTTRTAFVFADNSQTDAATRFVNEKTLVADVVSLGDFHVDLTTGVVSVFSTGALGATAYSFTYSNYASAPTGSNVSKFASALGDLTAGDFVKFNADSNYIEATTVLTGSGSTGDEFNVIMGQVLEVEDLQGKDALDKVRTAFKPALSTDATGALPGTAGQLDQMPGSATGGVTDKIHYAGASNLVVRINLISR